MAKVTVRLSYTPLTGTLAELFPTGPLLLEGWGRRAVADVQNGPWADARFKRATGRSRKAWRYVVDKANLGLLLTNNATNRSGAEYAKFVHYARTPRSAKVVDIVQAMVERTIAPEIVAALGRDFKRGLKTRAKKVVTS